MDKLYFASDYQQGAHPEIISGLMRINGDNFVGYGLDEISFSARKKILAACGLGNGAVHFLAGGTQTNAIILSAMLRPWQGVIAAETGHIATHEAGAIEFCGHKVVTVKAVDGKVSAETIIKYCRAFYSDENREHMVEPGAIYISQPTECGTLYSLNELTAIKDVCTEFGLSLYVDGARLAYALAAKDNDVTLKDLARLCDVFYIGGTKCGALFGEAVVVPDKNFLPHLFTVIKQRGGLLAKGWLLGVQFDRLFTDGLYFDIGKTADVYADRLREFFTENGFELIYKNSTNQLFVVLTNETAQKLKEKVVFSFWERLDKDRIVVRFATSWSTTESDVNRLIAQLI